MTTAGHQRDRQEHRDDRHRRRQHGEADLVGGVDRRLVGGFTHPHMPDDILDLDDRVVDQYARDQTHRQQRQAVQIDPHQAHEPEGGNRRQRDGERRDRRRAKIAQEQKHYEHGQDRALNQRLDRRVVLRTGVVDLVRNLAEMDARIVLLDLVHFLPHRVVDGEVAEAFGALDVEADHLAAVELGQAALLRIAVDHLTEVDQSDGAATADDDVHLAQIIGGFGVAEDAHRLLGSGDFGAAAGGVEVDLSQLGIDLRRGNPLRRQCRRIEHDADRAIDPALARHCRHARHAAQFLGDVIVDVPAQLLEAHVAGFGGDEGDRVARDVDPADIGLEDPVGQVAADLADRVADVVDGAVGRGADLELDEGFARSLADRAVDLVDAVDAADRRLDLLRDLGFHLARRRAGL